MRLTVRVVLFFVMACALAMTLAAQVNPSLYAGLRWRMIGPFRAGRVAAVTGVIGQPGVFYAGMPAGGVWKTDDAGMTWDPVFDSIKEVSSIGAVEVAPSDPNVVYVGTGDLITGGAINEGNGMYKSTDAGRTWQHIGLETTKQIDTILVDPHDPNLVLAAAQGNVHQASEDRGVYRSTDGGAHWTRVLFRNDVTGAQNIAWAYDKPGVIFATTVRHFTAPLTDDSAGGGGRGRGANGGAIGGRGGRGAPGGALGSPGGTGDNDTALYKSTDEGLTWTEVTGGGLPQLTGRSGVAVAPMTDGQRVFLVGGFGLYRSDDGGRTWARTTMDNRITGSAYICDVYVNPKNPDIIYTMNTSMYRSTDGGKTFISFKGAPGGDDNHVLWLDPTDGNRIIMGSDQGATITYNGGRTWSSWFNQPTVQVYTIGVDDRFPYWVYGIQQDTDAVAIRSRGEQGGITMLDWYPLPAWETGGVVADPLNNNNVYASSRTSGLSRIEQPSWHWEFVGPTIGTTDFRRTSMQPVLFSPQDPHLMYFATQYLLGTRDQGKTWTKMSPDLAVRAGGTEAPAAGGRGGGAINSISPSSLGKTPGVIWTSSNNGIVYVTQDGGKNWKDVTPPGLHPWSILVIEASHFDPGTAYVADDQHTGGDYTPHVLRTHDFGASWQTVVNGLPADEPSGSFVRTLKEDTVKKGLLFAGTESSMYASLDDGDHWQSLGLNLPNTSYRDMRVHGNDIVVGTYGRSFYILDDFSPLRQISAATASEPAYLFQPGDAIRTWRDVNEDSPISPELPYGENPPDGAILYYYLGAKPQGVVKLEILDAQNKVIRTMTSETPDMTAYNTPASVPDYWKMMPRGLPTDIGTNRVNWDLHYDTPPSLNHDYAGPRAAVAHETPPFPDAPFAIPGRYTVRLTVDGKTYTQPLVVKNDPREDGDSQAQIKEKSAELKSQLDLEVKIDNAMTAAYNGYQQIATTRAALRQLTTGGTLPPEIASAATALDAKLAAIGGAGGRGARGGGGGGRGAAPAAAPALAQLNGTLGTLIFVVSGASGASPTAAKVKAYQEDCANVNTALASWRTANAQDVAALNAQLTKASLQPLVSVITPPALNCGGN